MITTTGAARPLDRITRITMLLCFVKRFGDIYFASFRGFSRRVDSGLEAAADKTGRGRSRWRASSY
jgi:hypothetical protein